MRARPRCGAIALVLTVATVSTGCGRYAWHGHTSAAKRERSVSVGDGLIMPTAPDTTTATVGSIAAQGGPERAATTRATQPGQEPLQCPSPKGRATPLNVETRDDPVGVRLVVTVGNKVCYAPGEQFGLNLTVTNISKHQVEFDTFGLTHFSVVPVAGGTTWHDHTCGKYDDRAHADRPVTPPYSLDPGESVSFAAEYPSNDETREMCGGQLGEQRVSGFVTICTANAPDGDDCGPGRTAVVTSSPVRIRIG